MSYSKGLEQRLPRPALPLKGLQKRFGDLKVRPKLMVLHNLFFVVLAGAVYFSIMPLLEHQITAARDREIRLLAALLWQPELPDANPAFSFYSPEEGDAARLAVPADVQAWLDTYPTATWMDPQKSEFGYRKVEDRVYRRIRLPLQTYRQITQQVRVLLFSALALVYVAAVILLEFLIMPTYVYRPLRLMLDADDASARGERDAELIPEPLIPGDEIGQIMRSRNATIAALRRHEEELAQALGELEAAAADLKRKNRLLETAKRNLEQQDRLASIGLLSAGVAHELNTPLTVLLGSLDQLSETVKDPKSAERIARMQRVAERIRSITESLLDFSRLRHYEMSAVDISAVISEAWQLVAIDEKAKGVRFRLDIPATLTVTGNASRLVQVFVNLLRNALYAVGEHGEICVSAALRQEEGQSWVDVKVEDNGPGIPESVLPEVFEAFVTTRLDARGTGLGLTIAEGIVDQHRGQIRADNRPGGGACLTVSLPAAGTQNKEDRS